MPPPPALTVSAWVKLNSASGEQVLLGKFDAGAQGTQSWLLQVSGGKANFQLRVGGVDRSLDGTTTLSANTWYHIAGAYDGSNARLYVNGTQEASVAATGTVNGVSQNLLAGAYDVSPPGSPGTGSGQGVGGMGPAAAGPLGPAPGQGDFETFSTAEGHGITVDEDNIFIW